LSLASAEQYWKLAERCSGLPECCIAWFVQLWRRSLSKCGGQVSTEVRKEIRIDDSQPSPGDALLIYLLERRLLQRVEDTRTRQEAEIMIALHELIHRGLVIDSGARRSIPETSVIESVA
jgi:hypothetical protein